jgi:hypothetical protein
VRLPHIFNLQIFSHFQCLSFYGLTEMDFTDQLGKTEKKEIPGVSRRMHFTFATWRTANQSASAHGRL